MALLGLNLSNQQYEAWPLGYLDRIVSLKPQAVVFMAYSSAIPASESHRKGLHMLVQNLPGLMVILRILGDDTPAHPQERALEAVRRWEYYGVGDASITPWNEWNLPDEGGSEDWEAGVAWWEQCLIGLERYAPHVPRHVSALSPEGNYYSGYEALSKSHAVRVLADYVDVHRYTPASQRDVGRLFPGSQVVVTEFNGVSPIYMATTRAKAACWFIAGGSGWEQYDILQNSQLMNDFKKAVRVKVPTIGPGLQKAAPLIGPLDEDETYDLPGSDAEVSRIATPKGWATWCKSTNETVVYVAATGAIWRDYGNHGDGTLKQTVESFLA